MILALLALVGAFLSVLAITEWFIPISNRFFAMIWSENGHLRNSTKERLKELYVDSDKNAEALLLQASVEEDVSKDRILNAFNAANAEDLAAIVSGKPRAFFAKLYKLSQKKSRRNMGGRNGRA